MKIIANVATIVLLLIVVIIGCDKKDLSFRDDYLQGHEVVYNGKPKIFGYNPGYHRVQLYWVPNPDPTVVKYKIYWNSNMDSLEVEATSHSSTDTMKVMINNLNEYNYTFTIYSYDAKGNKSISSELNNVKVYGELYKAGLLNRGYNADNPSVVNDKDEVKLYFNKPDAVNIKTEVTYSSVSGALKTADLLPEADSIIIPDLKPGMGTSVRYTSFYVPQVGSLDTIEVPYVTTFPEIKRYVECNKSTWAEVNSPRDVQSAKCDWGACAYPRMMWDDDWSAGGQEFWSGKIFHSNGGACLPAQVTIDLGKTYDELGRLSEMGRNCCNSATEFEVWGVNANNIADVETTSSSQSGDWENEMKSKGWVLLKNVVRSDNGRNRISVELNKEIGKVRFVRLRVKARDGGGNGDFQIAEIGFWNIQPF